ncbi:MAG: hypothetical protein KDB01_06740 [Planctomycetaceae bacterium]|jgi:hypothetical protein|nr:hypothetical protein [Planctomycetaceae bacterium]
MKQECKFQIPRMSLWDSMFGRPLYFYGKGSVVLQDTGLMVHGDLPKFMLPFFGRFYARLITGRTMRTVPYSQVIRHKVTGRWVSISFLKILFFLLWFGGIGLLFMSVASDLGPAVAIPLGIVAFVVIPAVILMFDRATHYITYRLPSGKRSQFAFRLSPISRDQMSIFVNRLNELQSAAAAFEQRESIQ